MNLFIRSTIYKVMHKKIDETKLNPIGISVKREDIFNFALSSNTIMYFEFDNNHYFFRKCPTLFNKKTYYIEAIKDFFKIAYQAQITKDYFKQKINIEIRFNDKEVHEFNKYINTLLQEENLINKLFNAYSISQKKQFNIWEEQKYEQVFFDAYGLNNLPDNCKDIAIYFLWYMRNVSFNYRTLYVAHGKEYSHFGAGKSIASKIVAESLGLEHMITSAEYCSLEIDDGTTMLGVISMAAEGTRMADSKVRLTGSLQKELMNMFLLDLICFQTDHGVNNYNIKELDEDCKICAFDNDNPNTFFPLPTINYSFLGCSSIINSEGLLNRPYIAKDTVTNLLNLDIKQLENRLKVHLNKIQIAALINRTKMLQRLVAKTINKRPECVIDDDVWNEGTVLEELSGKYGKTYLTIVAEQQDKNEKHD